jgi:hypothetical protein
MLPMCLPFSATISPEIESKMNLKVVMSMSGFRGLRVSETTMARGIGSCLIDQMDCKIVPT